MGKSGRNLACVRNVCPLDMEGLSRRLPGSAVCLPLAAVVNPSEQTHRETAAAQGRHCGE